MAEHVQAELDRMVEPLMDLQEREIFTAEEIHAIVRRRRESEYALRRRNARQADFLAYIEAEMNLEKLRQLRVRRLKRKPIEQRKEADQQASKSGDKHIVAHIHLLWQRTLRKFRQVDLYLAYADFCASTNSARKLSRVYAEAVQKHPRQEVLWLRAAEHEFFTAGSIGSARILLQRALRINKSSEDLWLQSFALELHFVQRLQGRRNLLLGEAAAATTEVVADAAEAVSVEPKDQHKLARLVYDHAIVAVPKVEFRLRFLDQCRLFPSTEDLVAHMMLSIERDCGNEPVAWIARAMYARDRPTTSAAGVTTRRSPKRRRTEDPVLAVMRQATQSLSTEDMYLQAVRFVQSYLADHDGDDSDNEENDKEDKHEHESEQVLVARRAEGVPLLEKLFEEASKSGFYSSSLALEYCDFLEAQGDRDRAQEVLESFVSTRQSVEVAVWIRWAGLVSEDSMQEAVKVLQRGLDRISIDKADHLVLLVQLVGAKLLAKDFPSKELERLLMLYPGFTEVEDLNDSPFTVSNVCESVLACLRFAMQEQGLSGARKVYKSALLQSCFADKAKNTHADSLKALFDEAIAAEAECTEATERKRNLSRLFDVAMRSFQGSPLADEYRHARNDVVGLRRTTTSTCLVPQLDVSSPEYSPSDLADAYKRLQLVHLRNLPVRRKESLTWKDLAKVFDELDPSDQESWCVETNSGKTVSRTRFLDPNFNESTQAYCSFLIQKDRQSYDQVLGCVPVGELGGWNYEPALWIFFGRNPVGKDDMEGRPEHTDAVSHDGTWHYQLSGRKVWLLRPSEALLQHLSRTVPDESVRQFSEETKIRLEVKEGEVLVLNTRLWFHQTSIPPQQPPSVSYARDFRVQCASPSDSGGGMTNVDGVYATNAIDAGTIVFRETDMPDCELHRSSLDPNCEVVELEDGTNAVVSTRSIAAGEFFCLPESDSEGEVDDQSETCGM